jgi:hypothetical protein
MLCFDIWRLLANKVNEMDDFKYSVGQRVRTDFNGKWQEVIIISKHRSRCQTGKAYVVHPNLGSGEGVSEAWLHHTNENQNELF